jgi:hypothetical protein
VGQRVHAPVVAPPTAMHRRRYGISPRIEMRTRLLVSGYT